MAAPKSALDGRKDIAQVYALERELSGGRRKCRKCERILPIVPDTFGVYHARNKAHLRRICRECERLGLAARRAGRSAAGARPPAPAKPKAPRARKARGTEDRAVLDAVLETGEPSALQQALKSEGITAAYLARRLREAMDSGAANVVVAAARVSIDKLVEYERARRDNDVAEADSVADMSLDELRELSDRLLKALPPRHTTGRAE